MISAETVPASSSRLEAASRPVGGTFGTPAILEAVGSSEQTVIFDKKGNAVAIWVQQDAGMERIASSFDAAP